MQLQPGIRINDYTLEKRIGRGASGEVWQANDGSRIVAVKFLNEELIQGDVNGRHRQRFENEIEVLRHLHHPHIPALIDFDYACERPYFVMQYVGGPSYETLIASGEMLAIHLKKRLNALHILAQTLSAVHEQGIIHRDIKPASISGIETPYLLDFSIALRQGHVMETRQDAGTGVYMPPPDEPPGELTDMYSFALVAYEMLFGQHPIFTAENIGKTVLENRRLAQAAMQRRTWRMPSQLPSAELPGDLWGADLGRLDEIFGQALGPCETRYTDPVRLIADLTDAIVIPANQPYLDTPSVVSQVKPIPAREHYTDHEVERADRITNLEAPSAQKLLRSMGTGVGSLFRNLMRRQKQPAVADMSSPTPVEQPPLERPIAGDESADLPDDDSGKSSERKHD